MAPLRSSSDTGPAGVRRAGDDAFKLTVDYVKQEASEPLKGMGRFVAWGLMGSLAIAVGILLLLVGILRVLQEETGTALTGDWSWVPYFVVSVIGLAVIGIAAWRITAGPAQRKLPKHAKKSTETALESPASETRTFVTKSSATEPAGATTIESQVTGTQISGTEASGTEEGTS
jgi:hypothetical protein